MTPGILSVLPIFYVGWSDSVLSPSETKTIQALIEKLPHLTEQDKKLLQSWTDQRNPPSKETFAEWKHILQNHLSDLDLSTRQNLAEIGLAMAQKASSVAWNTPEIREKLVDFETVMGLNNTSSTQSFYHAIAPKNTPS
jgi:acyl-CoA oxidase